MSDSAEKKEAGSSLVPANQDEFQASLTKQIREFVKAGYPSEVKVRGVVELLMSLFRPLWEEITRLRRELNEQISIRDAVGLWGEQNAFRAETDPLTGLFNLEAFHSRAVTFLRQEQRSTVQVVYGVMDLANFKPINDRYGHPKGDIALRKVADVLRTLYETHAQSITGEERRETRKISYDMACRAGGDEFHFLVTDVATPEGCRKMIQRIVREINDIEIPEIGRLNLVADVGAVYIQYEPHERDYAYSLVRKANETADWLENQVKAESKLKESAGEEVRLEQHCSVWAFSTKQLLNYKPLKGNSWKE